MVTRSLVGAVRILGAKWAGVVAWWRFCLVTSFLAVPKMNVMARLAMRSLQIVRIEMDRNGVRPCLIILKCFWHFLCAAVHRYPSLSTGFTFPTIHRLLHRIVPSCRGAIQHSITVGIRCMKIHDTN